MSISTCAQSHVIWVTADTLHYRHQYHFRSNTWTRIVGYLLFGLQETISEISSHIISQSYCKLYHCHSINMAHEWWLLGTFHQHFINNACYDRWLGKSLIHCMAPTIASFQSFDFILVGTSKNVFVCSSFSQRRCTSSFHFGRLSHHQQLPRYLWTDAAFNDETCLGVHCVSWRTFWAFIINVFFRL
jgi:hypothetical protein